ncbi:MAG: sulfotransferase family 2 domain-containing protein [Planctomycetota bacterium]
MLISDDKRFVFVHVPKTGGTSITAALAPWSLPRNAARWASWVRWIGLPRDHRRFRFQKHGTLASVERIMEPTLFRSYFKFGFVRNPWDRLVSDYEAVRNDPATRRHARARALPDFRAYLEHEARRSQSTQVRLLADRSGEVGVDFVGRFERLDEDLARVLARLGIEARLPHLNRHEHRDYRTYYDAAGRDFVGRHWAADIEAFGYEF